MNYVANQNSNAVILFGDGEIFFGKSCGIFSQKATEICFNTAMTGYQEAITDPSYSGQSIIFSFPHIGNTGINFFDYESGSPSVDAVIMRNKISVDSNHRTEMSFENWLKEKNLIGIYDIDTRALIQKIRKSGPQNVAIGSYDLGEKIDIDYLKSLIGGYSCNFPDEMNKILYDKKREKEISNLIQKSIHNKYKIAVLDYGVKLNILHCLIDNDCSIDVISYNSNENSINFEKYDGIFLSNGPADPVDALKLSIKLIEKVFSSKKPIFGICLGHQIIALYCKKLNVEVKKMKQGHRGINHPIKNLVTNQVEITSQNHGFAAFSLNDLGKKYISHVSLFDGSIAGFYIEEDKILSVQYHPESSPGTHDSRYLFKNFVEMMNIYNK
jgi:carbamoyl-phosphate synthase small subunit